MKTKIQKLLNILLRRIQLELMRVLDGGLIMREWRELYELRGEKF
jgi:hypothetical protein